MALPTLPVLVGLQGAVAAASLIVEIVAGRMLAPYVGMSLYTWTSVIAVVLAGFSAGHWLGGRIADQPPARALMLSAWCLVAAAATTAAAVFVLGWFAEPVIAAFPAPVAAIVALTGLVFFAPSFFAGVPAPVLAQIAVTATPDRSGRALGAMFASGAIGAIAGTLAAGFIFIAWIGSVGTLAAVTLVYGGLAAILFRAARDAGQAVPPVTALVVLVACAGMGGAGLLRPNPCTTESHHFCIRVLDISAHADQPVRLMVLDHLAHGASSRDLPQVQFTDHAAMLDALALARMGDRPFSAFFIGGGTYSMPRAWSLRQPAPDMTVAEIDPQVTVTATRDFWFDPTGIDIRHADARAILRRDPARYDVIIGDAFTDIAVPPHLITAEFFALVADRLTPDGVYLMNVIDHAGRLDALAALVATLKAVFPTVEVWTERRPVQNGERMVFILLAAAKPSNVSALTTRAPDRLDFGRLSADWQARLLDRPRLTRLTDDYAPIDRLMTWTD